MCGRLVAGMPRPVSATWRQKDSSLRNVLTVILPNSGVNFRAFDSRLLTTLFV